MSAEQLKVELNQFISNLMYATHSFKAYKNLLKSIREYNQEINMMSEFVHIVLFSLQETFILETYKLVDDDSEKNLKRFLENCKCNMRLFKQEIRYGFIDEKDNEVDVCSRKIDILKEVKLIEDELEKYDGLITKLKVLRDKYYAHMDRKYFLNPDQVFTDNHITFEEIEEIQDFMLDSLNVISVALTGEGVALIYRDEKDLKVVLEKLKGPDKK